MSNTWKMLVLSAALGTLGLAGGCTPKAKMGQYTIEVSLEPSLASGPNVPTIPVDIVGVQQADEGTWNSYSMDQYFASSNPFRNSANRFGMVFGPGNTGTQTMRFDDAHWKAWKGAQNLYILADLPAGVGGPADTRRQVIPLDTRHWGGNHSTIQVQIQRSDIVLLTEQKPIGQ